MVKSGPRKPKLENLTLSQWSIANLAILYKLVGENRLGADAMLDYLSYTTKVYQLVQRFNLPSVLLYDREYRKLQATMKFRWGTDVQHLHTLCLQARDRPPVQGVQIAKKSGMQRQGVIEVIGLNVTHPFVGTLTRPKAALIPAAITDMNALCQDVARTTQLCHTQQKKK